MSSPSTALALKARVSSVAVASFGPHDGSTSFLPGERRALDSRRRDLGAGLQTVARCGALSPPHSRRGLLVPSEPADVLGALQRRPVNREETRIAVLCDTEQESAGNHRFRHLHP